MMVPAPGFSMARFWHIRVFSDFISAFFRSFYTNDIHTHHLCALFAALDNFSILR